MQRVTEQTLIAFAAFLLLTPLAALHAAEFFVSPSGSDADAGTKAKPFASLERARNAIREAKKAGAVGGFTVWLASR